MSQRTVARRYANALYEEADEAGILEDVDDDVLMLRRSLESTGELSRFFKNPVISQEKKDKIVRVLLEDRVEGLTLNFLRLLVRKDRETMVKAILDQYQTLRDEHRGIVTARVQVAQPLSDEDRETLIEALEAKTEKTIRLHVQETPELLGGLVIRIGDRVYDGSVRNQLTNLRDRLHESALSVGAGH